MNVLVTGAAGFVGSHLIGRLCRGGHRVLAYDRFDPTYDPDLKWRNLRASVRTDAIDLVVGDVCDGPALAQACARAEADVMVHLGCSEAGSRGAIARAIIAGGASVVEQAIGSGVGRVVLVSSSAVYEPGLELGEDAPPGPRVGPVGLAHRCVEELGREACGRGVEVSVARLFEVYGPGQPSYRSWTRWLGAINDGAGPTDQARALDPSRAPATSPALDLSHVADVVDGLARLVERPPTGGWSCHNLARGQTTRVDALLELLDRLGLRPADLGSARDGGAVTSADVPAAFDRIADISRARRDIGYAPKVELAAGLKTLTA